MDKAIDKPNPMIEIILIIRREVATLTGLHLLYVSLISLYWVETKKASKRNDIHQTVL